MSTSDAKTAEFAKLFDLFEMLATRRSRMTATESTVDDARAISVPAELEPVFRNLATIVPLRQPLSARPRRNTVAALGRTTYPDSDGDSDSDVESVAKFPLGRTYTFTFKMMIHKLYQVDEWAQKVRDVLKKSQIEYKPLAEQEEVKKVEAAAATVADGRVHFKAEVTVGGKKKNTLPLVQGRVRSHSVVGSVKTPTTVRAPGAAALPPNPIHDDTARAVKKRCIGRRKSVSGPLSPATPVGEGWIYDAAISSAEVRERVPIETTASFAEASRPRPRYQSLQSGSRKMGFGPRRVVSAATTQDTGGAVVDSAPRISTKRRLSE
ncbi:hypothetical protein C8R44DRAFT_739640 [Mycena epipterygia]|nr:hypothetical protein C8R44DRAFT_739640 [Mycena epipterygia]